MIREIIESVSSDMFHGSAFDFKMKNNKELDAWWDQKNRAFHDGEPEDSDLIKEFLLRKYLSIETYIDGAEQMFADRKYIEILVGDFFRKNFKKFKFDDLYDEFQSSNASNDYTKKFTNSIEYTLDKEKGKIEGSFSILGKKYKHKAKI